MVILSDFKALSGGLPLCELGLCLSVTKAHREPWDNPNHVAYSQIQILRHL